MFYRPIHKGTVTNNFGVKNSMYIGGFHDGVDVKPSEDLGWKCNIRASQNGFVYKVMDNGGNPEIPNVLYTIETDGKDYISHSYLHLSSINKRKGEYFSVGEVLGKEGNTGMVFSNGIRVTGAMRKNGAGHHLHDRIQLVEPVKSITYPQNEYLVQEYDGKIYQDNNGNYWHIKNFGNGYNGCIDPMALYSKELSAYDVWNFSQQLSLLKKLLAKLQKS